MVKHLLGPAFAGVIAVGCGGFRAATLDAAGADAAIDGGAHDSAPRDGGSRDQRSIEDGAPGDGPMADGPLPDGPAVDGTLPPGGTCRPQPLPCLSAATADVFEVPTEGTLQQGFDQANAGDTVQIKGLTVGPGWRIPAYVTLRGCQGAKVSGWVGFAGSGGTVEGFEVSGQVVANHTGAYTIRYNRFVGGGSASDSGVSATSTDALVAATVTAVVENNWFVDRNRGVEARTKYDTLTHEVSITIRNNVFERVSYPIEISEGGLVGKITSSIAFNTLYDFDRGISIYSSDTPPTISGTLMAKGTTGVYASVTYQVEHSMLWQVTTPHTLPPLSGSFASGDPVFVDAPGSDFRLASTSAAVDKIPSGGTVPTEDYAGCPRPVAFIGADLMADIGALESQP